MCIRDSPHTGLDKAAFLIGRQQLERRHRVGRIIRLLGDVAELLILDGDIGVIPCAEEVENEIAILEAKPGNAKEAIQEMRKLDAWRIRHVPSSVCGGDCRQRRRGGQRRPLQFVRYISCLLYTSRCV